MKTFPLILAATVQTAMVVTASVLPAGESALNRRNAPSNFRCDTSKLSPGITNIGLVAKQLREKGGMCGVGSSGKSEMAHLGKHHYV
jgi:hypothetical protein